jgi:hypothetical protein
MADMLISVVMLFAAFGLFCAIALFWIALRWVMDFAGCVDCVDAARDVDAGAGRFAMAPVDPGRAVDGWSVSP